MRGYSLILITMSVFLGACSSLTASSNVEQLRSPQAQVSPSPRPGVVEDYRFDRYINRGDHSANR